MSAQRGNWKLRRASQVLLHAVCRRHLLEKVGSSTLAVIPSCRGESRGCRSMVEINAVGTWEQGQNQESDERLVFSCDPMGVDGTKPDQERTSKCEAYEDARCPDAGRGVSRVDKAFGRVDSVEDGDGRRRPCADCQTCPSEAVALPCQSVRHAFLTVCTRGGVAPAANTNDGFRSWGLDLRSSAKPREDATREKEYSG
jgi:hypothetical protein